MRSRADPSYSFHSSHSHKGRRMRHPLFFVSEDSCIPVVRNRTVYRAYTPEPCLKDTGRIRFVLYTKTVFWDKGWRCFRSTETEYKRRSKSRILYRISTVGELISRLHHLEPAPAGYRYPEGRAALRHVTQFLDKDCLCFTQTAGSLRSARKPDCLIQ